ncbi:MAG: hypothetical protein Q8L21_03740, partial [Candidatus Komeilibacteria bacterium]|nr:hypothetical protein [Candidatus Komeilibacteria bacterium]
MLKINSGQQQIIKLLIAGGIQPSSQIHQEMSEAGENLSLVTVKRLLTRMTKAGLLIKTGTARNTGYFISPKGRIMANVSAKEYCATEPDKRQGLKQYTFKLFKSLPKDIFSPEELKNLNQATARYHQRAKNSSPVLQKKELERLII